MASPARTDGKIIAVKPRIFRNALRTNRSTGCATSPRFGVGSLLDLFDTRFGALNPITRFVDLSRIHGDRAWNRFGARDQLPFILHRFGAFDWKFPVMSKLVQRVKH